MPDCFLAYCLSGLKYGTLPVTSLFSFMRKFWFSGQWKLTGCHATHKPPVVMGRVIVPVLFAMHCIFNWDVYREDFSLCLIFSLFILVISSLFTLITYLHMYKATCWMQELHIYKTYRYHLPMYKATCWMQELHSYKTYRYHLPMYKVTCWRNALFNDTLNMLNAGITHLQNYNTDITCLCIKPHVECRNYTFTKHTDITCLCIKPHVEEMLYLTTHSTCWMQELHIYKTTIQTSPAYV